MDQEFTHTNTHEDASDSESLDPKTHLPRRSLLQRIDDQLKARQDWEDRIEVLEEMLNDGLERRHKPHAEAADLHFPLVDMIMGKLQPIYAQAVMSGDHVANFVLQGAGAVQDEAAESARDLFDHRLRYLSNWEEEILWAAFDMELVGRGVVKVYWDTEQGQLAFDAPKAQHVIVPDVKDLEKAPYIVHVRQLEKKDFLADSRYHPCNKDKDKVRLLVGRGRSADGAALEGDDNRMERAGITYVDDEHTIVLWEVYERSAGKWTMRTVSPRARDMVIREAVELDEEFLPFVDFAAEHRGRGWYDSRGAAVRTAPFEAWGCKSWNALADYLDFSSHPIFVPRGDRPLNNQDNFEFGPGSVWSEALEPLRFPEPPRDLREEIQQARIMAEQVVGTPDHAIGDSKGKARTAFEINKVDQLNQLATGFRVNTYLRGVQRIYAKAWKLLVRHDPEFAGFQGQDYRIMPSGIGMIWDRNQRVQEAAWVYDKLIQNPAIDADELTAYFLESISPELTKRIFKGTGVKQAMEAQAEAINLLLLKEGLPAGVEPTEDHATRMQVLIQKLSRDKQMGVPIAPDALQMIGQYIGQRMQALQQQNPQAAQQAGAQLQELFSPQQPQPGMPGQPGAEGQQVVPFQQ